MTEGKIDPLLTKHHSENEIMSTQRIASGRFLTEEGLALAKSTVAAIIHTESGGDSACPPPSPAARKIAELFDLMASGVDVELAPASFELTVSQTRLFLRTSERHVNELLDAGKIAFRMEGSERMVLRDSLLEFERKRGQKHTFLNDLLDLSQEMGTYDD